ncbi:thiol-disulfide isomerase/thioredoxin [Chitinophaga niastensis]|uniref:Thiol-disulfide isomerase/thioredoxin n=1 Tax=Chitinophaga niastensis TaxID=536980 RepID=A0A2P8HRD1_CHINA|nr:redoxin domain-containing protein [Chitinophaga niastensis]PSL48780.1 thiol-disulfide isomerase/thioredoxin [Chitinophaga niastensis]
MPKCHTLIAALILSHAISVSAQTKFRKNETRLYQLTTTSNALDVNRFIEKIYRVTIGDTDKKGNTSAMCMLQSVREKASGKYPVNYFSGDIATYKLNGAAILDGMALLYLPMNITIYANDSISDPQNLDVLTSKIIKDWALETENSQRLPQNLRNTVPAELRLLFRSSPLKQEGAEQKVTLLPADAPIPKADTALFSALVRMGWPSNYLKVNGEQDSARVVDFLALNDPKYSSDPLYSVAKLDVYQRSRKPSMFGLYSAALQKIPSAYIADNMAHLFNKLGDTFRHNPDSAMVLIRMLMSNPNLLESWMNNFFAQSLQKDPADAMQNERKSAVKVLQLMMQDKDLDLLLKLRPMYLWNTAMETTDTAILKNIAAQFNQVNVDEIVLGKAARYELLVYELLEKANLHKEANALLDKAIVDLKMNQADTAYWNGKPKYFKDKKLANKYILSHAYYLRYKQTLLTDKKAALGYLSQAAANAPKNNEEKVYESYYDRSALEGEESYQSVFARELNAMGKPEEAMKVLSKQLSAQPETLETVKTYFTEHFPGKSFAAYFREVLMEEWETAPNFVLTGLKNEQIRLSDYKGKWLLIDFWGTWCVPCREDFPAMNQLAAEINAGTHPNTALLAISCAESLKVAQEFMTQHQYIVPGAHSDGVVEKLYKVRGYPTKVLVSPQGKMLDLQFGSNYAAILQAFNTVYFKKDQQQQPITNINNEKKD